MRYAIFGDVHSNIEAYETVLEAIRNDNVAFYYCTGDIVGYGANPVECINRTKNINPVRVAGNHDWGAAGLLDINDFTANARAALLWTINAISEADKKYLGFAELVYDNELILVHSSPNRPEEFTYIFGLNEVHGAFRQMQELKASLCFTGHTHAAGIFVEDRGHISYNSWPKINILPDKRYIVNVGSVGQPRDTDPRASYCIYDSELKQIEIKRVRYDIEKAQAKIIEAGLPRVLADRLGLGK